MNLLVLGRGLIGAPLAQLLETHGHEVTVLDRSAAPWLGTPEGNAELRRLVDACDTVINTVGRLTGTEEELREANDVFVGWLVDVIEGSSTRLVHVGSASEYGDPGSAAPIAESAPCVPLGAYGTTKHAGSLRVLELAASGHDAVVARGFNLVSNRVAPSSPIAQWLRDIAALKSAGGDGVVEVWEGQTLRDFIQLDDAVRALAQLGTTTTPIPTVVNLCSGVGLHYGEIVRRLVARAGINAEVVSLDQGGIMSVIGDPSRLISICGFVPEMHYELLVNTVALDA